MSDGEGFGALLRRHRRNAGLTQEDLAERAGLSVRGISDLERGLKLAPHSSTVEQLIAALGVTADDAAALQRARSRRRGVSTARQSGGHRLPAEPTPLVGREREVAEAVHLTRWEGVRLLTFTGPGGVGKTHLALRIAASLASDFAEGAAWVPLASLSDPEMVPDAAATVLDLQPAGTESVRDALLSSLRERHLLLVLDNFEHLLASAGWVADLLASCPRITVLVTTRERLNVRGEHEFPVDPLPIPAKHQLEEQSLDSMSLRRFAAVELFLQRARAANLRYQPSDPDLSRIARICAALDGLPLAIELTAARLRTVGTGKLLSGLERRLQVLTDGPRDLPERQQTMHRAIAWSYRLLDDDERRFFRGVSSFAGGCTEESADAVMPPPENGRDSSELLRSLAGKSLLSVRVDDDETRFIMLETIREYGREQLQAGGETEQVERRHADYFRALAERSDKAMMSASQHWWIPLLEREHDNLRAALGWSLGTGEVETGLRIAGSLWRFWDARGHQTEGRRWLSLLLEAGDRVTPAPDTGIVIDALYAAGALAYHQAAMDEARASWERSLELARRENDQRGIARALNGLGILANFRSDFVDAGARFEECAAIWRQLGDKQALGAPLNNLALAMDAHGEFRRARDLYREVLDLYREDGDTVAVSVTLTNLAEVETTVGEFDLARHYADESLRIARSIGDVQQQGPALTALAGIAESLGETHEAVRLNEEALEIFRTVGDSWSMAWNLVNLGSALLRSGNLENAASCANEGLERARAVGARRCEAAALASLADVAAARDALQDAEDLYRESLELMRAEGYPPGIADALEGLAHVSVLAGKTSAADEFYREADTLREEAGAPLPPARRRAYEADRAAIRRALGHQAAAG